ncbi:MAG: glutaredoxin [Rickettsiales bacterium]
MTKKAVLYRMLTDKHICPYGLKTIDLLESKGYQVEDHILKTRSEVDKFKAKHKVKTTPQIFINKKRIGGHEDLQKYLGVKIADPNQVTYKPVAAIFAVTALLAAFISWNFLKEIYWPLTIQYFVGLSMCVLAILKLQNLDSFSNQFITYDLLAKRWLKYAYIYPFAEAFAGIGMVANIYMQYVATVSLFIGTIGAISVIKAVYIDKRELKCACVGGNSRVPLGFISLTENLAMVGMGIWMIINFIGS